MINLIKNAAEALDRTNEAKIELSAGSHPNNRIVIQVSDNGPGIEPSMMDEIFVPFFSTKETGSGIGLSLSRQIVLKHKGSLSVQSRPGAGTVFTIII